MRILITGSSGFIGTSLLSYLRKLGHELTRVVRNPNMLSEDTILWDPERSEINPQDFEGFNAVINLAGENIATSRWTDEKKRKIYQSRVHTTRLLCDFLSTLDEPPKILINASAIGYYGDQGDTLLTENSPPGNLFLSSVCQAWEEATEPLETIGSRVVKMRFGMVLSKQGGALKKMLTPFRLGLGGVIGSGRQYVSWITLDELLEMIVFVLENDQIQGPVNAVSPNPITNYAFTKALGKVLNRPTIFPMPAFLVRLLFGQMGDELLLASTRVSPGVLSEAGYSYLYPEIDVALKHLLQK